MEIIPAIDLKNGACVRLIRGEMDQATVYSDNPAETAAKWEAQGASRIHVVDLDGAFQGEPMNLPAIRAIVGAVKARVQIGGGIRDLARIDEYLDSGVDRVILGTIALEDPQLVRAACAKHPGRIVVGIDARDGLVAVRGWAETSKTTAVDLVRELSNAGVAAVIYTDISRDGMLSGPNYEATREMAAASPIPVIASGGISAVEDLLQLTQIPNVQGAIVGKALYTGRIDLADAIRRTQGS
jgi:phosphoribosylformimino-5-aminoimidazole carboxamide ribotide isomerase